MGAVTKPCKIGQTSVKCVCSYTRLSVTNAWLLISGANGNHLIEEYELVNITLICMRNATYLAAGPWTGLTYKNS